VVALLGALSGMSAATARLGVASPWDNVITSQAAGDLSFYALTKALIARESGWDPAARRDEPALGDASWGLMQVLLGTARGISPGITAAELRDPVTNIVIGTAYLRDRLRTYPILADAVSAYNAGRPTSANQGYVDDVLAYYAWYWSNDPVLQAASGIDVGGRTPLLQLYTNTVTGEPVDPSNVSTDSVSGILTDTTTGDPVMAQESPATIGLVASGGVLALLALGAVLLLRR
jgi:hypothetical protein